MIGTVIKESSQSALFLCALSLGSAASAHKTSQALPKGIFRARVVNVFGQPVMDKFDQNGDRQELLAPLERNVGASALAASALSAGKPELKTLYDTLNSFEPHLGDQLYSADLLADAKINFRQTTAALEYGLTKSVSIGVIVPFTQVTGSSSFGARVTSNSAAVKQKVKGTMLEDGVAQFEAQMPTRDTLADSIFTSSGYKIPGDFSYAGLGDIEVGAFVQTTKSDHLLSGIQAGFRLPTATHKRDYTNLLDQGTGDEQLDFAVEAGFDAHVTTNFMAGFHTRYTLQIARRAEMPILKSGQSGLPNLRDPSSFVVVDRNLGDYLENEVYLDYTINSALSPYVAYTHTLRGSDQYKGPAGYNYASLESDTAGQSHTIMVGFTVSTLNSYLAKQIPVPLKFDFSFNKVLAATNKTESAYGRLDLIVFF